MSAIRRLLRNENNIDFPGMWKKALTVSVVLLLIAIGSLIFRGLNLGIEFEGGASWEVSSATTDADQLRSALEPFGIGDARVCLLYTSPSPRDRTRSRMPSSA